MSILSLATRRLGLPFSPFMVLPNVRAAVLPRIHGAQRMSSPIVPSRLGYVEDLRQQRLVARCANPPGGAPHEPEENICPQSHKLASESDDEQSLSDDTCPLEQMVQEEVAQIRQELQQKGQDLEHTGILKRVGQASDKALFFAKLGVRPDQDCHEIKEQDKALECYFSKQAAEDAWTEYRAFHLNEIERLQGIDRQQLGLGVAQLLKSEQTTSIQKARLSYFFNMLLDMLSQVHQIDLGSYRVDDDVHLEIELDSSGEHIKHVRTFTGASMQDKLPLQIAQLAEMIQLDAQFFEIFNGLGGVVNGDKVEFKSGLKVKTHDDHRSDVTFDDVAGIDVAKAEFSEVVDFLKNPAKFKAMGARIPRGVLLEGGPGVGKTLLAKAVAGEAGVPFFSVAGSEFVEQYVGVGAQRVRELFEQARAHAPCIVFVDEIDAVGRSRQEQTSGAGQEHEQTLNQLLVEMDGFGRDSQVIVVAATNRAELLDRALTRPGRFDRRIEVPLPAVDGREAILRVHAKKIILGHDVDFRSLAKLTGGFSGAELANLVNEAALCAIRRDGTSVTGQDFEVARDRLIMGATRAYEFSERDRQMTAYHEAGHALVAHYVDGGDDVYKVTILPKGGSLGATHFMPGEENGSVNYKQLLARLAILQAGRLGEAMIFGEDEVTTGASDDLRRATQLARDMVEKWGYSPKVGTINLQYQGHTHPLSPQAANVVHEEVSRLLSTAQSTARRIIEDHRDQLDAMANLLVEKETIDQSDLQQIYQAKDNPSPESSV